MSTSTGDASSFVRREPLTRPHVVSGDAGTEPEEHSVRLCVSEAAIPRLYVSLMIANAVFIVVTCLNDLGVSFATTRAARQFDLKEEATVAVWYSSFILLLTAMAALGISQAGPSSGKTSWRYRYSWYAAALFFFWVSID